MRKITLDGGPNRGTEVSSSLSASPRANLSKFTVAHNISVTRFSTQTTMTVASRASELLPAHPPVRESHNGPNTLSVALREFNAQPQTQAMNNALGSTPRVRTTTEIEKEKLAEAEYYADKKRASWNARYAVNRNKLLKFGAGSLFGLLVLGAIIGGVSTGNKNANDNANDDGNLNNVVAPTQSPTFDLNVRLQQLADLCASDDFNENFGVDNNIFSVCADGQFFSFCKKSASNTQIIANQACAAFANGVCGCEPGVAIDIRGDPAAFRTCIVAADQCREFPVNFSLIS